MPALSKKKKKHQTPRAVNSPNNSANTLYQHATVITPRRNVLRDARIHSSVDCINSDSDSSDESPEIRGISLANKEEDRIKDNMIEMLTLKLSKCQMEIEMAKRETLEYKHELSSLRNEESQVAESNLASFDTLKLENSDLLKQNMILSEKLTLMKSDCEDLQKLVQEQEKSSQENSFRYKKTIENQENQINKLNLELRKVNDKLSHLSFQYSEAQEVQTQESSNFEKFQNDFHQIQSELQNAKICNKSLQEEVILERSKSQKLEKELLKSGHNNKRIAQKNTDLLNILNDTSKLEDTLQTKVESLTVELQSRDANVLTMKKCIDELNAKKVQQISQSKHLQAKLKASTLQIESIQSQKQQLEMEIENARKLMEELHKSNLKYSNEALVIQKRCRYLEKMVDEKCRTETVIEASESKSNAHPSISTAMDKDIEILPDASRHPDSDAPNWLRY